MPDSTRSPSLLLALLAAGLASPRPALALDPPLLGRWTFEDGAPLADSAGYWADLTLHGTASVSGGRLDVDAAASFTAATGWAGSGGYSGPAIGAKTLVSWVQLDDLDLFSGSAITLDSLTADKFDAVVYGEREAYRWTAGSDNWSRTSDAVSVDEGSEDLIQMAISYASDGTITICRDGEELGSYVSSVASPWVSGDAEILFGARHTFFGAPIGGLDAHIEEARLYGGAMSCGEAGALSLGEPADADGDGVPDDADDCPCQLYEGDDADGDGCVDPVDPGPSYSLSGQVLPYSGMSGCTLDWTLDIDIDPSYVTFGASGQYTTYQHNSAQSWTIGDQSFTGAGTVWITRYEGVYASLPDTFVAFFYPPGLSFGIAQVSLRGPDGQTKWADSVFTSGELPEGLIANGNGIQFNDHDAPYTFFGDDCNNIQAGTMEAYELVPPSPSAEDMDDACLDSAPDADGDGLSDAVDPDDDNDDLSDADEATLGTDPLDADSDDDALTDGEELDEGTDPLDADSDNDGLSDGEEVAEGTDPADADSDDDGVPDDADVCALVANPSQHDLEDDGIGDVCDADDDNDSYLDDDDAFPADAFEWDDTDGDGVGDNGDAFPDDPDESVDSDGDGVGDAGDPCAGFSNVDNDGDDTCNDLDVCPTDPLDLDGDNDGVCDIVDLCVGADNVDADGDQVCDDLDQCQGNDAAGDTDGDDTCDSDDNCATKANADQADADLDGIGNACEADTDADGIIDDTDNCDTVKNVSQSDIDNDSQGDACDGDDDNDGVVDGSDNCPFYANASQIDFDHDGMGDACDGDDDADSVSDERDVCPGTPLSTPFDSKGCSGEQRIELECGEPQDYPFWKRGNYVACVTKEATTSWKKGLLTVKEKAALIREAAIDVWFSYICRLRRWI